MAKITSKRKNSMSGSLDPSGAFNALLDSEFYLLSTYVPNADSIYDVRTRGGRGSPKSRQKEQNLLISVCDPGWKGVTKIQNFCGSPIMMSSFVEEILELKALSPFVKFVLDLSAPLFVRILGRRKKTWLSFHRFVLERWCNSPK